jgi:hypothetical protein
LLWIVLGFVGSLGLSFVFHDFLFEHVSLFRGIRVPARWATVTHVGLAITAAFGALRLIRGRIAITALLCVALLAELRSAPIRYVMAPTLTPEVYRWLANARTSAVLELPIGDAAAEYEYMLRATAHRKRTVNGISGFAPDSFESIAREFRSPRASDDLATTLASRGVDLILVHGDRLGSQGASIVDFLRRNLASGRLSFVRNFEDGRVGDYVFRIERTPVRELPTNVRRFLDGQPVLNRGPFGVLDTPGYNVAVDGALSVVGWAVAAEGVQQVNLRFNNGAVVVPATLWERPDVRALYPGSVGFRAEFPKRPPGVSRATDIEVEVIDRRGVRSLVPDRWFIWN